MLKHCVIPQGGMSTGSFIGLEVTKQAGLAGSHRESPVPSCNFGITRAGHCFLVLCGAWTLVLMLA